MTPEQLDLIAHDAAQASADPERLAIAFYNRVFEFAPQARSMFAPDLTEQRRKLVAELKFLVDAATAYRDPEAMAGFVRRAQSLGARHVGYAVTAEMYEPVAAALVDTLRSLIEDFDDAHELAWRQLLAMLAETMLEGAAAISVG